MKNVFEKVMRIKTVSLTVLLGCAVLSSLGVSQLIYADATTHTVKTAEVDTIAITELSKKLQQLNSFTGEFQQTLVDSKGELIQSSSGDFSLLRPGYFRWETVEPFPQLLVSNLDTIWLFDPDLEQVTVKPYDDRIAQTPALLLSGDATKIAEYYTVHKESDQRYLLLPFDKDGVFTQLHVTFIDEQLSEMALDDSLGQTTTFTFINGVYNAPLTPALFEFTPPPTADIITGQ